ncbi:MAG: substrate-binding domain-containing protein [Bacteroidales bacterium]|nr:substrate-binding domain-containing protein [Lentimicrobiaceae bacterium]MDD5695008.1 substrate-binding domain-containing protein [Bacteroidales bacterium]
MIFIITLLTGCKGINRDPYADTPTTGRITIGVDESFRPILEAELMVFHGLYHYAEIQSRYLPEQMAVQLLLGDSVRLVVVSRLLKKEEKDFFRHKDLFPRELKIATDAVALVIHPDNPDNLLAMHDFQRIMTGEISQWSQVNPANRSGSIEVIFDNQQSSTVRFIHDSICSGKDFSKHLYALEQNLDVVDYVAKHENALGLIGVSWISDMDDTTQLSFLKKINVLALSREEKATWENSYQPFQAYISDGSYPLTRDIYAISTEPRNGLATGFMAFLASDKGQRIILKAGILPAQAPVRIVRVKDHL